MSSYYDSLYKKNYRIKITSRTIKMIANLKRSDIRAHDAIKDLIEGLKTNPRPDGVKKLKGYDTAYRLRYKDYRIVYHVDDDIITIVICLVGSRKDVYKQLSRMDLNQTIKMAYR